MDNMSFGSDFKEINAKSKNYKEQVWSLLSELFTNKQKQFYMQKPSAAQSSDMLPS